MGMERCIVVQGIMGHSDMGTGSWQEERVETGGGDGSQIHAHCCSPIRGENSQAPGVHL